MRVEPNLEHRVPPPKSDEALSSWISRLALEQGCSLREMLDFLGQSFDSDIDLQIGGRKLSELRRRCNLPPSAFAVVERMMSRLSASALGKDALYRSGPRTPRFLFCPLCLKVGYPRTLSIFWRFIDWRHCPTHACLMETNCWKCRMHLQYPHDMAQSFAGQMGFASQHRCQFCGADLSDARPVFVDMSCPRFLATLEGKWLWSGRQIVETLGQPRPAEPGDFRAYHPVAINCLPTKGQWQTVARIVRDQGWHDKDGGGEAKPRLYAGKRRNWGRRLLFTLKLNEAGYFDL